MVDISKISDGTNTYDIKDSEARSELSNKQDTLVSGTNIKTINGDSILGSGNITIESGTDVSSNKVNGAPLSNTSSHFFGVSTSAATDTEKVVSIPSITELTAGVAIIVLPTITSTVANATLKLNNFTAYPMRYQNSAITTSTDAYTWTANTPSVFVFDGEYWRFVCQGYRQVYSTMSVSEGTTGTATTGRIVRADYLKSTILGTKLTGLSTSTTGAVAATDTVLVGMGKLQATKADKSAIPTVNDATLTIQKNGTNVATFTANASSNVTANITVPTKTSDLTNDSGYTTNTGTVTSVNNVSPVNGNVTISIPTVDQSYSETSANAQSGIAVKSAIDSAVSSVYKAAGSVAYASLPTPAASNEGYVYNVTNAFTTDSRFVEGSGKTYPAGTNVVIINTSSSTYKFDVLAGMVDLSGYVPTTRTVNGKALSNNVSLTASDVGALPSSTVIPTISDTYSATSSNGMSGKAVASAISGKVNSSDLATVATSGSYNDLSNKPTIPVVDQTYNGTSTNAQSGVAINNAKFIKNNSYGSGSIDIIGYGGSSTNSVSIGLGSQVGNTAHPGDKCIAIGYNAIAKDSADWIENAIQIGEGLNYSANTMQVWSYQLLNKTTGKIPDDRLNTTIARTSSLPSIATTSTAGLVKPDGTTITVDTNGTISSASSVDIDEETITKNNDNELQVVAVKNKRDDSTLGIWHGTETQWNRGVAATWNYWQTDVQAMWTASTMPSSANWESVIYGDGKFVAIAENSNKAAYSTDGINWTASTLPTSTYWESVTYGNGKFIAVIDGSRYSNKIAYSTDGINWTETTMPNSMGWRVSYGDDKFVAIATDVYNKSDKAAYSTDGINWTASTLPSSADWRVIYGDGKFVAVAYNSDKAAYSTDGINWTETTMPSSAYWSSVTYGDGKFVAITASNKAAYSTDGINWTASTLPSYATWRVIYGDGKFVAVAYNNSDAIAVFTVQYDKCYTLDSTPTTSTQVYSEPEITSTKIITSVGSGTITLSDNLVYNYTPSGNQNTYRTLGDAHPDWLCNIDNVGVKIGNTIVATAGGSGSSYTAGTGIDITNNVISANIATSVSSTSTNEQIVGAKLFYDTVGDIESTINTIRGV